MVRRRRWPADEQIRGDSYGLLERVADSLPDGAVRLRNAPQYTTAAFFVACSENAVDRPQSPQRAQRRTPGPHQTEEPRERLLCACRAEALIEDLLSEGRAFAAL